MFWLPIKSNRVEKNNLQCCSFWSKISTCIFKRSNTFYLWQNILSLKCPCYVYNNYVKIMKWLIHFIIIFFIVLWLQSLIIIYIIYFLCIYIFRLRTTVYIPININVFRTVSKNICVAMHEIYFDPKAYSLHLYIQTYSYICIVYYSFITYQ